MSDFYMKVVVKLLAPLDRLEAKEVKDFADKLRAEPYVNARVDISIARMLYRIANLMALAEWVLSDKPVEELDDGS